jgi:catalase
MTRGLDPENLELDDPAVFSSLKELTREQQRTVEGSLRRGQHAKPTGLAEADFIVSDDVAEEFRCGVFQSPGASFRACVRFSDSQGTFEPDGAGTARGVAIKLFEVKGPRAIPRAPNSYDR